MPLQERGRFDQEQRPQRAWQQPAGGGQEDPILDRESRPQRLAAQDRDLVAEPDYRQCLGVAGATPKNKQLEHALRRNVADDRSTMPPESKSAGLFYVH